MTEQLGESCPIVALLRHYTLGCTAFEAVLLLLQQNRKYRVRMLTYFSRLDVTLRRNDNCSCVFENSLEHFHVAIHAPIDENGIAELSSHMCSL
jgi:hypothetical protein